MSEGRQPSARRTIRSPQAGGARGRSAEETIHAMLEAGQDVLLDQLGGRSERGLLDRVRAAEVCRRLGLSTPALFYWWPNQEAYRSDLLDFVLSRQSFQEKELEVTEDAIKGASRARGGFDLTEAVRVGAITNAEEMRRGLWLDLHLALWAQRRSDPRIGVQLRAFYDSVTELLRPFYQQLLTGRRFRPPFTVEHLATAVAALEEGLHVRWTIDPERVPDDLGGSPTGEQQADSARWSLFAAVAHLIVEGMTEAEPAADQAAEA